MGIFSRGLSTISLIDYSHEHIQLWFVHNIINQLLMSIFSRGLSTSQQHNQINTTGVTSGAGTAFPSREPEFTPGFQWGSCYLIFRFICMFCRSLFVLLYLFFWPLCCLFFYDIRILITPLVSSNSSAMECRQYH